VVDVDIDRRWVTANLSVLLQGFFSLVLRFQHYTAVKISDPAHTINQLLWVFTAYHVV